MVHELKVFTQTSESPDVHEPHASIRYFYISEQSIILPLLTNSALNYRSNYKNHQQMTATGLMLFL